jgi:hypothetical protein
MAVAYYESLYSSIVDYFIVRLERPKSCPINYALRRSTLEIWIDRQLSDSEVLLHVLPHATSYQDQKALKQRIPLEETRRNNDLSRCQTTSAATRGLCHTMTTEQIRHSLDAMVTFCLTLNLELQRWSVRSFTLLDR